MLNETMMDDDERQTTMDGDCDGDDVAERFAFTSFTMMAWM
jgi:hypothetical protein